MRSTSAHRFRFPLLCLFIAGGTLLALALSAAPVHAAQTKNKDKAPNAPKWIYPAIPGFGGVHPRPDLPVRPNPKESYKIFVDVVTPHRDPSGKFDSLERLARLVNLMAYAKVPRNQVHIVALLDEDVGYASGTNAFYRKAFGSDNPNLALIHALKKAGVKMLVCSQGLAEGNIPDNAIDPAVTITLSALTDMVVYGHKGYTYMRL